MNSSSHLSGFTEVCVCVLDVLFCTVKPIRARVSDSDTSDGGLVTCTCNKIGCCCITDLNSHLKHGDYRKKATLSIIRNIINKIYTKVLF